MPFNFNYFNNSKTTGQKAAGPIYGAVSRQAGIPVQQGQQMPVYNNMYSGQSRQAMPMRQAANRNQMPAQQQMMPMQQNQALQQAAIRNQMMSRQQTPNAWQSQAPQQTMNRSQMPTQQQQMQPMRQRQAGSAGMSGMRQNMPQMPMQQQMAPQPFLQNQPPQSPANTHPTGQMSASQVSQYMQGETNGIPINKENINQLIKTFNESDAQKNQTANPSFMGAAPSDEASQKTPADGIINEPQRMTAFNGLDKLAQHIQNETNGIAFYSHLADMAPTNAMRQNFEEIVERCNNRAKAYGEIYRGRSGKQFEAKNVVINNQVSFKDGVQLALNEEKKSIADLFVFYESLSDSQLEKSISCQLFRKLCDLNVLLDTKFSQ